MKELLCAANADGNPDPSLFRVTDKGREYLKAYRGLKALMR